MNHTHYTGVVIHGDGYGRKLGYPTANVRISEPFSGVFVGGVKYNGQTYSAALFATVKRPILEAHLLDFDGDLYGKEIEIHLHNRIRDAEEFEHEDDLRAAIMRDVQTVRAHFAKP